MINRLSATPVLGLSGVVELGTGASHTCARRGDGSVSCCGWNSFGGLGDWTTDNRLIPGLVWDL